MTRGPGEQPARVVLGRAPEGAAVLPALEQRIFELFRLAQPAVFPEVKSSRLWDTELGPSP